MSKDFMNLGGREVRVEVNWNAITEFLQFIGEDSYEGLANIGSMRPSQVPALIAASVNEGERLEGRESKLSALDVGAVIRTNDIKTFMEIYVRQSAAQMEEEDAKKKTNEEENGQQ